MLKLNVDNLQTRHLRITWPEALIIKQKTKQNKNNIIFVH